MCLISIITPSLNRAAYVTEAIESVLRQDHPDFEHLVVDGGSADETLEILNRYPHLRVISEPDRGLYDAINKGLRLASGEIIGLLNTDDLYEDDIFATIQRIFRDNPEVAAVVGGSTIFRETRNRRRETVAIFSALPDEHLLDQVSSGLPPFNGWFFRKNIFDRIGYFDLRYRYSADRDFLIRMALIGEKYVSVDKILYHYRQHAGSLTFNNSGSAESDFIFENRALAEDYLSRKDLPPEASRKILSWHSQLTAEQVLFAISRGNLRKTIAYARRGLRFNKGWPWIFMKNIPPSARRIWKRNLSRMRVHISGRPAPVRHER